MYWADLRPPAGRRPVCVLTRDAVIEVLTAVTCAPITRTVRGIRVISCDNVITVPIRDLDGSPVGRLNEATRAAVDQTLRYSLDIIY